MSKRDGNRLGADRVMGKFSIALLGTRGAPARYGGFETCVEEVGARLAERGHAVRVYCRQGNRRDDDHPHWYRGMQLIHRSAVSKRSLETLSHTASSAAHLIANRTDVAIVFNAANAPVLPALRAARIPVATHVDGLEWQRAKWGPIGTRYYRAVERLSVRWSDALIADAQGIADHYMSRFSADTELISYGAPEVVLSNHGRLEKLGLIQGGYHLVVARFEPENHVDVIVDAYTRSSADKPLIVVGSAPYSDEYIARVHGLADQRVRFLGGVWDQDLLDDLYAGASTYLHGHSVGGTNPSLLRAIGAGAATTAFDVVFNREVLGDAGMFFTGADDLVSLIEATEANDAELNTRKSRSLKRASHYNWDDVADRYEILCSALVAGHSRSERQRLLRERRPNNSNKFSRVTAIGLSR